jgi:gliding motility-associated-like protein
MNFSTLLAITWFSFGGFFSTTPNNVQFAESFVTQTTDTIRFPNAFMPSKLGSNGGVYDAIDYTNEVFHPVSEGVVDYKLLIFTRWGELIFECNDVLIGWDGYFKGKLCNQDVYMWKATGKFSNGKKIDMKGNVTLLR